MTAEIGMDLLYLLRSAPGTSRQFAAAQQLSRSRRKADIRRAALTMPDL
jgi:hypothetical protein